MLKIIQSGGGDALLINVPSQLALGLPPFIPGHAGLLHVTLYELDGTVRSYQGQYAAANYAELVTFMNNTVKPQLQLTDVFSMSAAGDTIQYLNHEGFTSRSAIRLSPHFLLDKLGNADMAYSLRRLRDAYTGYAVRVRRSTDNAELDIGFDTNGHFDGAALTSFLQAAQGHVAIWYDQTGNERHMLQPLMASQPRVLAGQVNGRHAVVSDGADDYMLLSLPGVLQMPFCVATLVNVTGGIGERCVMLGYSSNAIATLLIRPGASTQVTTYGYRYVYAWPQNSIERLIANRSLSTGSLLRNGVNVAPSDLFANSADLKYLRLFAEVNFAATAIGQYAAARMPELIIWGSAAGDMTAKRTDINTNINWYYNT